ncbi:MAG: hypothetical protein VKL39_00240 [Leptolyngbyaceae bacterium]|nr:hypothetical protein [Leptolyngbyaceae bacterium]
MVASVQLFMPMKSHPLAIRLEQYTLKHPAEVLLVHTNVEGEEDQVIIFRGFSSSLMRSTAYDPDVPVIPEGADIVSIDRLKGPYTPDHPHYLQSGLSVDTVQPLLENAGV